MKTNKNKRNDKEIAVLQDSKIEIQNRLDIENQKLSNKQQKTRDLEKHGNINPFDFNEIGQHDC